MWTLQLSPIPSFLTDRTSRLRWEEVSTEPVFSVSVYNYEETLYTSGVAFIRACGLLPDSALEPDKPFHAERLGTGEGIMSFPAGNRRGSWLTAKAILIYLSIFAVVVWAP